tara:strand:+ start:8846 stop:9031 length:186 start_codon:yes stop_codon:yes gene_type:complete
MYTLDQIRLILADRNASAVARACGLGVRKILAVKAGRGNPSHATIVRIIQYLEEQKNNEAA